jgi:hypothetical protein
MHISVSNANVIRARSLTKVEILRSQLYFIFVRFFVVLEKF